jgi:hypothetical protein
MMSWGRLVQQLALLGFCLLLIGGGLSARVAL